ERRSCSAGTDHGLDPPVDDNGENQDYDGNLECPFDLSCRLNESTSGPTEPPPMPSRVCVFGSINMDVVVRVGRFPGRGETVAGTACDLVPGGKGANQAVAVANMGVPVGLVGALG